MNRTTNAAALAGTAPACLAGGGEMEPEAVRRAYDAVAPVYAQRFFGELAHKPFDRMWLDRLATLAAGRGQVCDLGCGPGQVARYLRERGAGAIGADLSLELLREARRLSPGIPFLCQDMLRLGLRDGSLAGIACFYAIVHFSPAQVETAFQEMRRVLAPGGHVLVAFHAGHETRHVDEFLGSRVSLDFTFLEPDEVVEWLERAGLAAQEVTLRYPYKDVEVATKRAYILAQAPA